MKRFWLFILLAVVAISAAFLFITRNGMPSLNIKNVESVSITNGLAPIKQLKAEENRSEIENLISMYNSAKRSYRKGDTTTDIHIVFKLKNEEEVAIQGNTQSYQYVYVNGKHYKIAGKELTDYIRSLHEEFNKNK